jgi:hypothetical protein
MSTDAGVQAGRVGAGEAWGETTSLYLTESGVPQMLAQSITELTENR